MLLATYGGEAHLGEQLDSLAAQQGVDWRLLWRDDGSTDGTFAILERFTARHPGRVSRLPDTGRLGAGPSFMTLLAAAPAADAYAFMDQDDVWLPEKLAHAARRLAAGHELVCGRLRLVDESLHPIGLSPLPGRAPGFASLLAHNVAAGCTMLLSPRGREMALSAPLPAGGVHDWWCALLVAGCGGRLYHDPEPMILYRQHAGNLVGGAASLPARAWRALSRGSEAFRLALSWHLEALRAAPLTPEARAVVEALRGLPERGPLGRLRLKRAAGLHHHDRRGDVLLSLWLLLGAPPRG